MGENILFYIKWQLLDYLMFGQVAMLKLSPASYSTLMSFIDLVSRCNILKSNSILQLGHWL